MWWNRKEDMHMRGVATLLLLLGLILSNMFVFVNMAEGAVSTGNTASLITSSQRVHQNSTAYPTFGISATSTGTDRLSSITVRVYPVNGFTMGDLQTISRDATVSGIALYRDDGNVDDLLDPADTPVNATSTSVTSSGTYYTVLLSYGTESIPSSVSGQYHWILTFRTSTSIADGDIFYLSIPAGGILFSDSSSQPSVAVNTSSITCHHTFLYPLNTAPVIMGERGTPTSERAVVGIAIDSGVAGLEHLKSITFSVAQSLNISRLLAPLSTDPSTSGVALYRDNGSNTGDVFSSTDDWGITPQTVTYLSGRITLNFSTSATETLLPSVRTGRHEYFLVLRTPENLQDAVRYYLNFSTISILVEGRTGEVRGLPCYTSSASVLTDSSPPSLTTATISITSTSGYFWAADTDGEGNDDRVYYNNLPGQGSGQFVTIRIRGYGEDNPDYMEGEPAFNQRPEGPKDDRDQTDQQITYRITSYGTVDNPLTVKLVDKAGHITFYNVSFLEDNTPPRINSTWIRENSPYIYGDNESREIFFRPEMPRPTPLYIEGRAWEPANESGLWMATFSEEGSLDRSPSEDLTPAEFSGMYLISSTSDSDSSPISVYVYDHVRNFVTLHYNYTNVTGRPEVSILNPLRGSTVSGTVTVSARVNSTAPIYSVKVSFDGGKSYREMYPWRGNEYRYTWDTFSSPEGVVVMVVRAEDVVNGVRSTGSWVRVDNYPLFCDIVSPSYGEALRGVEEIEVNTSSYATVVRAYVGNTLIAVKYTNGEGRVVLPFDTRMVQDGTHTLRVKVWGLGNETTESTVTIMVDNTPPTLLSKGIIYPRGQTGLKRGDNATFLVRLQDNTSGVAEVEGNFISLGGGIKESFYDDGMHGDGGANDGIWATSEIKINATWAYHVIKVWVKDRAGNVLNFTWKVAVDNHPPLVERAEVLYPNQQIAAKWGDKVRIRAKVSEKTTPVYVSLVLDTSGSMQGEKISRLKEAARTFINYTRSIDYISIYRFTPYGTPLRVLNFTRMNTSGKARAIQIVNSLAANASTPIWDAIGSAVLYTLQNSKGASATVAITDGQDDILRGYPFEEASNTWCPWHNWTETRYVYRHLGKYMLETPLGPVYQWFDNPIYEYRRGLLRAPIPIFTIGLGLEHHSPPDYPRAPQRPLNNSIDNKYAYWAGESGTPEYNLWRIATTSAGGRYYYAPSASQLISIFRGIAYSLFSQDSPGKVTEVKIFSEILPGGELNLFDDGNHSDGDPGDGLFGSDAFTVRDPSTTIKTVSILVKDWAGNQNISSLDFVLDNLPPEMRWARVLYPEEQGYVADGQKISLLLNATDNGTGVVDITADMSSLGYLSKLHLTRVEGDNYTVNNITVISGGIPNGHYRVPIEVLDGAGNSVVQMVDVRVVNDHAAPEIYLTKPLWGEVVGEILEIEAVILDESGILWANATLSGGDGNITAGYLTQDGNVWRLQISTKFIPEGAYNLTVSAVDITRKVGISTAVRIYIDRGSPIIVVWSPHPGEVLKGTVWLNYTLQENNVLQANIIVDGGVVYPLTMRFNTRLLPDGPHRLTFQVTDIAGRTSKVDVDVIVDNTPPELSPIVPTFGEILEGEVTLAVNVKETAGLMDYGGYITDPSNKTYIPLSWEYTGTSLITHLNTHLLPDDTYSLFCYVIDLGNRLRTLWLNFSVDNHPPMIEIMFPYPNATLPTMFSLQATIQDIFLVEARMAIGNVVVPANATLDLSKFPEGEYTFTVWASDMSGKMRVVSFPVYIDRTPPKVVITSPLNLQTVYGESVIFTARVRDISPLNEFYFLLDGDVNLSATHLGGGVYSIVFPLSYLDHRLHRLKAVAVDGGGLMGSSQEISFIYEYLDTDGDGVLDQYDDEPLNPDVSGDIDGDGRGTKYDDDDDGDGVPDREDAFPLDPHEWRDTDGDGIGDNEDDDDDGDGIPDRADDFPLNATEWKDTDGDGIGNNQDPDDDNDGVVDRRDAFPENPTEWRDTDGDGVGDNEDDDDDGDGVPDWEDAYPWNPKRSYNWAPLLVSLLGIIFAALIILSGMAFKEEVRELAQKTLRRFRKGEEESARGRGGGEVIIPPPPRPTRPARRPREREVRRVREERVRKKPARPPERRAERRKPKKRVWDEEEEGFIYVDEED